MVGAPTTAGQIAARFAGGQFGGLLASQMFGVRHGGINAATGLPLVIFGTVRPVPVAFAA